jgi:hypothetical protein
VDVLARLTADQLWKTDTSGTPPADVYGWNGRGCGWYVKLKIEDGRLHVLSFHPPEHPFRTTKSGDVVR